MGKKDVYKYGKGEEIIKSLGGLQKSDIGPHEWWATQIFRNKKSYTKPMEKKTSQTGTHHLFLAEK